MIRKGYVGNIQCFDCYEILIFANGAYGYCVSMVVKSLYTKKFENTEVLKHFCWVHFVEVCY